MFALDFYSYGLTVFSTRGDCLCLFNIKLETVETKIAFT